MCLTRLRVLLLRISECDKELKAYVVLDRKYFVCWSILAKAIFSQSTKKHFLLPETGEERVFASHWMDFYISTFTGKCHLSQLNNCGWSIALHHLKTICLSFMKRFWDQSHGGEKKILIGWMDFIKEWWCLMRMRPKPRDQSFGFHQNVRF